MTNVESDYRPTERYLDARGLLMCLFWLKRVQEVIGGNIQSRTVNVISAIRQNVLRLTEACSVSTQDGEERKNYDGAIGAIDQTRVNPRNSSPVRVFGNRTGPGDMAVYIPTSNQATERLIAETVTVLGEQVSKIDTTAETELEKVELSLVALTELVQRAIHKILSLEAALKKSIEQRCQLAQENAAKDQQIVALQKEITSLKNTINTPAQSEQTITEPQTKTRLAIIQQAIDNAASQISLQTWQLLEQHGRPKD